MGIRQAKRFRTQGHPIYCALYGMGHINETFLVKTDTSAAYIMQKINTGVFQDPVSLMRNISSVTSHVSSKKSPLVSLRLIPTTEGFDYLVDDDGFYWRMYNFIENSICLQKAETEDDFRESAVAFGTFQNLLSDFPAHTLVETIPHFHDTPYRYRNFQDMVEADAFDRVAEVVREIDFVHERAGYMSVLMDLWKKGDLPLRVTHNDTKLNNVLLDEKTRKALCVIDLDTVMPGFSVNDYGDSIRFGASLASEDETDLSKVVFSLDYFEAYTDGFLSACGSSLTDEEILHLRDGAKMMTLECGMRFLTDYISGDVYFRIHRAKQNIDRCRTQFSLVSQMEQSWDQMEDIIVRKAHQYRLSH
ncbi:phosphotransferase enzyme family protein [Parasphaerochaeta coccoides]|uniref:Aminoglycoside phosphotransferase n=1 Tax=Parasphaerochaeta coccoides (strain ATCC BAA-1237 / DSM 17374 / SPN1) TaxID=760011 RepID=F4GH19_PARC1|nr:phosphotransferase [Parasphaerochaeta coccoides]AEC01494.1 aminoglycoside phosphotransferase [Parasphaerochaeta coccoides DSM 17374]